MAADFFHVSDRTVRSWLVQEPQNPGRKGHSPALKLKALLEVRREVKRQGWNAGCDSIRRNLPWLPTRLVQHTLSAIKKRHRYRLEKHRRDHHLGLRVQVKGAVYAQDRTHLGRMGQAPVDTELVKDRGSLKTVGLSLHDSGSAQDIIELLELIRQTNGLPLVWMTDNGSAYRSDAVLSYLARHKVIALPSRPYCAQDNGAVERYFGELKAESQLGKGVIFTNLLEAQTRLFQAIHTLDDGRLRASKGYQTASCLHRTMPHWQERVTRDEFYARAKAAMRDVERPGMTKRQLHYAWRIAVYDLLEAYGLAQVIRPKMSVLHSEMQRDTLEASNGVRKALVVFKDGVTAVRQVVAYGLQTPLRSTSLAG